MKIRSCGVLPSHLSLHPRPSSCLRLSTIIFPVDQRRLGSNVQLSDCSKCTTSLTPTVQHAPRWSPGLSYSPSYKAEQARQATLRLSQSLLSMAFTLLCFTLLAFISCQCLSTVHILTPSPTKDSHRLKSTSIWRCGRLWRTVSTLHERS